MKVCCVWTTFHGRHSQTDVAKLSGRSPATISRELRPNRGDLVTGHGHSGAIVTLAERRTQAALIRKVDAKASDTVRRAMSWESKRILRIPTHPGSVD